MKSLLRVLPRRWLLAGAARAGKKVLVIDGQESGPEYNGIKQVVFARNNRVNFIALRGDTLLAVSRRIPDR